VTYDVLYGMLNLADWKNQA